MAQRYLALLLFLLSDSSWAYQFALSKADFPRFTLAKGSQSGEVGEPTSGAKLCILKRSDICYQMPPQTTSDGKVKYQFGLDPRSERLPLAGGGSWVFFASTFSGGGSGSLERLAVLRFDDTGAKIVNLLPFVGVTNEGDRLIWMIPSVSSYPILINADFIWADGEVHFDRHYYTVEAWCFNPKTDQYVKALSYRTAKRYDGSNPPVHVLAPERQEIIRRFQAARN